MAAEYKILVKNEITPSTGTSLYYRIETTTNRRGDLKTDSSSCKALTSYGDGSFYLTANLKADESPKITFYTKSNTGIFANNCSSAIGSISPLASAEPVANDIIITLTNTGVSQANSPTAIEPPRTANPGGGRDRPGTNPGTTTRVKQTVVRFFAPWTNTSAILVTGTESIKMTTAKNYCGWFETKITPPTDGSIQAYFKQTLGYEYVNTKHDTTKSSSIEQNLTLALDSADTIWVKASKEIGAETKVFYDKYPGVLGDCPTKTLPVMMFDWLHGTDGDIKRDGTVEGTNGDPINGVSADFGSGGCAHHTLGMVEPILGPNGVPVPADPFPEDCKITTHLDKWFLPEVVAQKDKQTYTNATCRSIELTLDDDGLWLGQKDNKSKEGGLFLLDDFEYLDAERTIANPYFDNISASGKRHNFGFTMKIQATFEYIPGQYFEFFGDDDVWVFINNRLVVDIGGQHTQVFGSVDLDTLGLEEGKTYPFHIFYAERHSVYSNFMMKTSIDLKTEASLFYKDLSITPNILDYQIYQIIREQTLSCDFSGTTAKDTVDAPSNFTLIGSGAYSEGVPLDSIGTWFGGITIKPGYTGFTIDTALIKKERALPPGTYQLRFSLQRDETQYDEITFVIDKYASPPLNYARVDEQNNWTLIGANVDGRIDTLGKWVNTRYPVNITFADGSTFDDIVYIKTNNEIFIPCDENGNKISAITLKNGKATFYVKALAAKDSLKIVVSSADESTQAIWDNISLMEPPVPQITFACIFDRNGDGRGDSVYAKLSKPYGSLNVNMIHMDSVQLEFGEKFQTIVGNFTPNDIDSSIAIVSPEGGFGSVPFTGGAEKVYSGKITPYWLYSEGFGKATPISLTSDVLDSIGPVITSADISYSDDGSTVLLLTFSEGLDCENDAEASIFKYFFKRTNTERTDIVPDIYAKLSKAKWRLIFRSTNNDKANIPVMGDSIKMIPGVHMDLLHRSTPESNPFVRIAGEQNVVITSAPVVTIGESDSSRTIIKSPTPTVPKIVQDDKPQTAKEVAASYGTQGHYLGDLSLSSLVKDEITNLTSAIKNFNNKSVEKNGVTLEAILADVQAGKMSIETANKNYKLGNEIVLAYKNEIIKANDVTGIANGNASVIEKISRELAKKTTLEYKTQYFTSLGVFVNSTSNKISCVDSLYNGNCLDDNNDGKIFLAWNMKSKNGRLVGTGVYIARLTYKIRMGKKIVADRTQDFIWGVRHGKTKGFTIDLNE